MSSLRECYTGIMVYADMVSHGNGDIGINEVREALSKLIEQSRQEALAKSYSEPLWLEGLFPVAAWIDETLLCSQWRDRKAWQSEQLQRHYFNMTNAGELFFSNIDDMATLSPEVLGAYELVLSSGFKGRYFRKGNHAVLAEYKEQLRKKLGIPRGQTTGAELFADAYREVHAVHGGKHRTIGSRTSMLTYALVLVPPLLLLAAFIMLDLQLGQLLERSFGPGF